MQRDNWRRFKALLNKYAPFDLMFDLGDPIDGTGNRSGGTELISTSLEDQVDMAVDVRNAIRLHGNKGFKMHGVYGTAYHTASSDGDDWDSVLAKQAGYETMGSHDFIDVNGCVFDLKHNVGSSAIPHGRFTAPAKEKLWNQLWHIAGGQPNANVILRGHVHYHTYCGGAGWLAMTLPSLQGAGTKYGARQCSGTVEWGITIFDVDNKGQFDWTCDIVSFQNQSAEAIKA